ncbi:AAA family ATPase [Aureimonas frigidaquae]|uniref:AAA family ATPase n=1 Tax=Aureimonas frigidaquae TaxID=424757 RepID=UPI0007833268|nr:AAA family ATPase [Aureimonas frigidaquae]
MLKTLEYSVTFPSTGRALEGSFHFERGFGAIVGPNEAGKSVILEMIRFCLFGTAALRGQTSDYKTLKAALTFQVRDETFKVERRIASAKLLRDGTEVTNGVKAVNTKVAEILGFGITVFDVACAANQGDIEKLGAMKPTERKQMVDSVIGLSVIDDLTAWCSKEALGLSRMIEGLERGLQEPKEPVIPKGYRLSAELQPVIVELNLQRDELNQIDGWLAQEKTAPVEPKATVEHTVEQLEEQIEQAQRVAAARKELGSLPEPTEFDPASFEHEHDAYDLWQERKAFLRNHPRSMTAEAIAKAEAEYQTHQEFRSLDLLQGKFDALTASSAQNCCPSCNHTWPVELAELDKLEDRLEVARDAVAGKERVDEPDMRQVALAKSQLEAWDKAADKWGRLKDVPEAPEPRFTRRELAHMQVAKDAQSKRPGLEAIIAEGGGDPVELNRQLRERLSYEAALKAYRAAVTEYEAYVAERAVKVERAKELRPKVADLPDLSQKLFEATAYEAERVRYDADLAAYVERVTEIAATQAEEEAYRKGKAALILLRKLVKQHLIPSLNRVASHLINQMTGGQRQKVEVSDEFEIMVDDQRLDTLSGSGKAVANLALRLGLGQVLTNGQLSVFLGDEIDASMDKDRAQNTALTLEYLKERISQILLVSHKYPSADYYIELGKNEKQVD